LNIGGGGLLTLGSANRIGDATAVVVNSGQLVLAGNEMVSTFAMYNGGVLGGSGTLTALSTAAFSPPAGSLLVVEVAPWWPMVAAQRLLWAMRPWPMFFWTRRQLTQLVAEEIPNATLEVTTFRVPRRTMLPPVFAWPWLRIPRGLYPFTLCLYDWRLA
jgi:hypothetical protein